MNPREVYCLECAAGTERELKAFEARVAELEFENAELKRRTVSWAAIMRECPDMYRGDVVDDSPTYKGGQVTQRVLELQARVKELEAEIARLKPTGIVSRVDDLGRIVIPREVRQCLHIREGDPLEVFVDGTGRITLRKREEGTP